MELPVLIRKYPFEVKSNQHNKTYLLHLPSQLRAEILIGQFTSSKPQKIIDLRDYELVELIVIRQNNVLKHTCCSVSEAEQLLLDAISTWRDS